MIGALAIEGGTPVRDTLLAYGRQSIDPGDVQTVIDVQQSDWLPTEPRVIGLSGRFAADVGARHAVAVSSGTAALPAAAFWAGLGPDDEAFTSPLLPSLTDVDDVVRAVAKVLRACSR